MPSHALPRPVYILKLLGELPAFCLTHHWISGRHYLLADRAKSSKHRRRRREFVHTVFERRSDDVRQRAQLVIDVLLMAIWRRGVWPRIAASAVDHALRRPDAEKFYDFFARS